MIRRPRLALPFSILADPGVVRLVAGEDVRYTLRAPALDEWLPQLLARCDGSLSLDELLASIAESQRTQARELIERLHGERVVVDGPAAAAHRPAAHRLVFEASRGRKPPHTEPGTFVPGSPELCVLWQDCLDLDAALQFNRRMRGGSVPWLWVSTGAMSRAYVSPVLLPDAGPCLGCLLRHFRLLSPAREIHDALLDHGRRGTPLTPVPFPDEGIAMLEQLVRWKARLLGEIEPPGVLYRLHVLEADTLEVSTHRVLIDPECPECGRGS
jgi:bacteriocin biosynthesis cyclodehydratase domain-containing protein